MNHQEVRSFWFRVRKYRYRPDLLFYEDNRNFDPQMHY